MISASLIATIVCLTIFQLCTAEKCPGPGLTDLQESFKQKFDEASIVAYGTVSSVTNNVAKFQINCLLKGLVPLPELELTQLTDVTNTSECHYLTASKSYIVFLQATKPNPSTATVTYSFLNMEEMEITLQSVTNFIKEECEEKSDENADMTIFYYANERQCGRFETKCNDENKKDILAMKHKQLTSTTTFLGGFKTGSTNDVSSITGKSGSAIGTGDEKLKNSANFSNFSMSIVFAMISFVLLFKA